MIINLSEIMSVKGSTRHIQVPIELEYFTLEGQNYPFSHKEEVNLTISHIGERKLELRGDVNVTLVIPCNRCLLDVITPLHLEFEKELDFSVSDSERIKELDETNYISGYNLDVDLLVYDEILVNFPMKVLCNEDCKGFCKVCGENLNTRSCACREADPDPRMSVIRDIFNNFKEV